MKNLFQYYGNLHFNLSFRMKVLTSDDVFKHRISFIGHLNKLPHETKTINWSGWEKFQVFVQLWEDKAPAGGLGFNVQCYRAQHSSPYSNKFQSLELLYGNLKNILSLARAYAHEFLIYFLFNMLSFAHKIPWFILSDIAVNTFFTVNPIKNFPWSSDKPFSALTSQLPLASLGWMLGRWNV